MRSDCGGFRIGSLCGKAGLFSNGKVVIRNSFVNEELGQKFPLWHLYAVEAADTLRHSLLGERRGGHRAAQR